MTWRRKLTSALCLGLIGVNLAGCRSLRDEIRQAMSEEPENSRADSQWTTHSTSTKAVPSVGSRHHGDFGSYSQPTTGEKRYHSSGPQ